MIVDFFNIHFIYIIISSLLSLMSINRSLPRSQHSLGSSAVWSATFSKALGSKNTTVLYCTITQENELLNDLDRALLTTS